MQKKSKSHWTEESTGNFLFRVGADFVSQLLDKVESQKDLAKKRNVSKGAVSQMLNNPGNLKLKTMIEYARALGMKIGVLLYDDDDKHNENGPIHPDIFRICWERNGKPKDFWSLKRDARFNLGSFWALPGIGSQGNRVYDRVDDANIVTTVEPKGREHEGNPTPSHYAN
jgi:transcriptional regulator with XRE-family HTH domain